MTSPKRVEGGAAQCPICRIGAYALAWRYATYDVFRCGSCELEFAWPPSAGDVSYYQSNVIYSQLYEQVRAGQLHPGTQPIIRKAREVAERYVRAPHARVADIGCGSGYLLAALRDGGFDCVGYDFNPDMCRIVTEFHGIPAYTKSLSDLVGQRERFDYAIMSHVLEHLDDPVASLRAVRSILNADGTLFVCLPNRNFIRQRKRLVRGQLPSGDYPPHHVTFWSTRSLYRALIAAGFEVRECYAQSYPEPLQAAHSLTHTRNIRNPMLARAIASLAAVLGRWAGVPGANLFAVAHARG